MSTIWNPKKNIPLYQTSDFPALWKTIIDKPAPGMQVGTGWLTPDWINFRGHNEKEHQQCIIYHWPREIVPTGITEKDKLANLMPHIEDLVGKAINKANPDIPPETVKSVISLCYQIFVNLTSGPVGGLPLLNLLNMDGSLTFIYAHWYEGTPSKFQWVMDVNWDRYNRLKVFNQQVQQLEIDTSVVVKMQDLKYTPQMSFSTPITKAVLPSESSELLEIKEESMFQLLEGRIIKIITSSENEKIMLYHPTSDNAILELKSEHLNLARIPDFHEDNLVQVIGNLCEGSSIISDPFRPNYYFEVEKMYFLKNGRYLYNPPLLFDDEEQKMTQFAANAVCPVDVRNRILKEVAIVKDASEKLSKIEWKKYGAIAVGVSSLLGITLSAALGILSTSTAAGPAIASYIIRSKIASLIAIVSTLTTLEGWATAELAKIKNSNDLLVSLKLAHPECFKD